MNITLDTVLQVKPSTWSSEDYNGKNCVTVQISSYSDEYHEIENDLRSRGVIFDSISKMMRVQHPFAYGRFLLRKEQLEKRKGYSPSVARKFYKVSTSEVQEALEYNVDNRRTSSLSEVSGYFSSSILGFCIVVTKRIDPKSRDSEEYPEYVIYF